MWRPIAWAAVAAVLAGSVWLTAVLDRRRGVDSAGGWHPPPGGA